MSVASKDVRNFLGRLACPEGKVLRAGWSWERPERPCSVDHLPSIQQTWKWHMAPKGRLNSSMNRLYSTSNRLFQGGYANWLMFGERRALCEIVTRIKHPQRSSANIGPVGILILNAICGFFKEQFFVLNIIESETSFLDSLRVRCLKTTLDPQLKQSHIQKRATAIGHEFVCFLDRCSQQSHFVVGGVIIHCT